MSEDIIFDEEEPGGGVFQAWKIREGASVQVGTLLATYKVGAEVKQIKASGFGTVQSFGKFKAGDSLEKGLVLMKLKACEHPVVMKDLCADCGEDLREKHGLPGERVVQTQARVAMIHHIPELQITPEVRSIVYGVRHRFDVIHQEAKNYGTADEQNLLQQRRLVLLVDLDQTLIHTTNEDVNPNYKDVHHFQLYGQTAPWYHTRLRPNTRHFLESMTKLYELHICTFGARLYAHTVAKILDPEGNLFGHRILSREECFDANLKIANLKALFPCGDRLVSIIDDREDVWNFAPNVVHVKPYRFFKHTGDINAPPGYTKNGQSKDYSTTNSEYVKEPTTTGGSYEKQEEREERKERGDQQQDEAVAATVVSPTEVATAEAEENSLSSEPTPINEPPPKEGGDQQQQQQPPNETDHDDDDYLYHLEDILTRIHTAFYQMYDQMPVEERPPDLKSVVPYVKNKVLKSCNIVFSGVVPTNVPIETSAIYKAAVAFGANVQKEIVFPQGKYQSHHHRRSCTTHLVAAKWGTAKVVQATKPGSNIKIVTPQWLWCCVERWEREDERLFLLETKRRERRKDDEPTASNDAMDMIDSGASSSGYMLQPATTAEDDQEEEDGGDGADDDYDVDLDYEPNAKKMRGEEVITLDDSSSSSSSSSESSSSGSKSEDGEERGEGAAGESGDEEMAEALEKQLE